MKYSVTEAQMPLLLLYGLFFPNAGVHASTSDLKTPGAENSVILSGCSYLGRGRTDNLLSLSLRVCWLIMPSILVEFSFAVSWGSEYLCDTCSWPSCGTGEHRAGMGLLRQVCKKSFQKDLPREFVYLWLLNGSVNPEEALLLLCRRQQKGSWRGESRPSGEVVKHPSRTNV